MVHVLGSQQRTVKLPAQYHSARDFVAISPSQNSTSPLPLVIMLSGYCLPAMLQDDVRQRCAATPRCLLKRTGPADATPVCTAG